LQKIARNNIVLIVLILISSLIVMQPSDFPVNASEEWSMGQRDLARTGYTSSPGPTTSEILWTFKCEEAIRSGPAIANGIVYFGSDDGHLYALNATTGELLWKFKAEGKYDDIRTAPAVAYGRVYFGSRNGSFFCVNATTGELLWKISSDPAKQVFLRSSPAVWDGKVYFGGRDWVFYCADAFTGQILWTFRAENEIDSSPAIVNGIVYFGSDDDNVYALNATTGDLLWKTNVKSSIIRAPLVAYGLVFVAPMDSGERIVVLNATTGEIVRIIKIVTGAKAHGGFALAGNKLVFAGNAIGKVYCIDITTWEILWSYSAGGHESWASIPVIAGDIIYVLGMDARVHAIDLNTGQAVWTYQTDKNYYWRCDEAYGAVANGCLFIGAGDGTFYCFGSQLSLPVSLKIMVTWSNGTAIRGAEIIISNATNQLTVSTDMFGLAQLSLSKNTYSIMIKYMNFILRKETISLYRDAEIKVEQSPEIINQLIEYENTIQYLQQQIRSLNLQIGDLNQQVQNLNQQIQTYSQQIQDLNKYAKELETTASNNLYLGVCGGLAAGLVIGATLMLLLRKKR